MQKSKIIEITIADDNIFLAEALAENLNKTEDIIVKKTHSNLTDLLDCLPKNPIDILILDINFNGVSSLDYIDKIRSIQPNIKIVALTTLNNHFIKQNALSKGVDFFVGKDSSYENFDEFIRNCSTQKTIKKKGAPKSYIINGVKFTETKVKVLRALFEHADKTEDEIAENLNISTSSLKSHKRQLYQLTGTTKILDLIRFGINNGILIS